VATEHGRVQVVTGGQTHTIDVSLDRIAGKPHLEHTIGPDGLVRIGSLVKVGWNGVACLLDGSRPERHRVVVDLLVASLSLSMVAVLQNVDVVVVGRDDPAKSGAYAAVSVTSKAIVFGAVVIGGYLLT